MTMQGLYNGPASLLGSPYPTSTGTAELHTTGAVRGTDLKGQRYDLIPQRCVEEILGAENLPTYTVSHPTLEIYRWINNDPKAQLHAVIRMLTSLMGGPIPTMRRLAETCAEGAAKYDEWNWLKGFPISGLLNHALRHLVVASQPVLSNEDDLAHALWNVAVAYEFTKTRPDLMDIGPRKVAVGVNVDDGSIVYQHQLTK